MRWGEGQGSMLSVRVGFLLFPHGYQGLTSSPPAWPQAPSLTKPSGQTRVHWLAGSCYADQAGPHLLVIVHLYLLIEETAWCEPAASNAKNPFSVLTLWNDVPAVFRNSHFFCCCSCPFLPLSKRPECELFLLTVLRLLASFIFLFLISQFFF